MKLLDEDTAFELVDRLGHAYALFDEASSEIAEAFGVTGAELVALVVLASMNEALNQSDWGRLQGVSRQRAHVVTRSLVEKGLVGHTRTGRESRVSLTAKGKRESTRWRASIGRAVRQRMGAIPVDRALELHALLGTLVTTLEATRNR